ncbi:enterobactin exporter EntS [Aquimixticola soesokkakensis]|uniref:Enterobactin exporter EntS n=1 Tax=Aquimixticola soesokkakensis TaxID=1519096 RepID=A0A1Y5TCD0_9RHOB|nr:MFS transporter [Aquimixticola soesokkakensis]SLN57213.1 enterobactin exporter EntS [Aquimixticola soesokkakensis]
MGLFSRPRTAAPKSPTSALGYPAFRRFFASAVVSMPGNWMQITAQAWLVLEVHNSPMALAWVTTLQFMPILLFTLMGGALADRVARKPLLIGAQIVGGLQALVLGMLIVTGHFELWHLYGLAVILGFVNAIDGPLRQAVIADLVPREALSNGVALGALTQNIGRLIGPALAGLVIAGFGVGAAFFINTLTYLSCVLVLMTIRIEKTVLVGAKVSLITATREGLGYALKSFPVRFILVATAFIGIFGQNFTTMIPLVASYLLHASPAKFGLLNSALGAGSLAALLMLTRMGDPTVRRILIAGLAFGVLLIAISQSSSMLVSCALFAVVGAAAVVFSTSVQTALQLVSPPHLRGRLASMVTFLIVGTSPLGAMMTGAIASNISVAVAIAVNGGLCALGMGIAVWMGHKRQIRFEPDPRGLDAAAE